MYDSYQPVACGRNGATTVFIVLSSITFAITTLVLPLRVLLRLRVLHSFWWDDVTIIISYFLFIPWYGLVWRMIDRGLGWNIECVSAQDRTDVIELEIITEFFQILCGMFARISVALFVGRLFAVTKTFRYLIYGYTVFMAASMIVTAVLTFTVCFPLNHYWHVWPGSPTDCTSSTGLHFRDYYNGAVSVLSDLVLALIPVYFLNKLKLNRHDKHLLIVLMGFGCIPAVFCLLRTIFMSMGSVEQPLQSFATVVVFGGLEPPLLIIGATIPSLRPLLNKDRSQNWRALVGRGKSDTKSPPQPYVSNVTNRPDMMQSRALAARERNHAWSGLSSGSSSTSTSTLVDTRAQPPNTTIPTREHRYSSSHGSVLRKSSSELVPIDEMVSRTSCETAVDNHDDQSRQEGQT